MKIRYSWVLVDAKEMESLIRRVKSLDLFADDVSLAKMPVLGNMLLSKGGFWDDKRFTRETKLEFCFLLDVVVLIFWPMFKGQRLVSLMH